ncbi:MAG: hypothetical protein GY797_09685 [Deltaproteobacteria bacterium]|nr:hypothetical protein [Deltaproteobacteria bacterium]
MSNYFAEPRIHAERGHPTIARFLIGEVWNYDVPVKKVTPIATSFWEKASQQAASFLEEESRCFVTIWVNVNKPPLRCQPFVILPTPRQFEICELVAWFQGLLKRHKTLLSDSVIHSCLERLKNQKGHIIGSYRVMGTIIIELNNGGAMLYE